MAQYKKYSKSYKIIVQGQFTIDRMTEILYQKLAHFEKNFNFDQIKYATLFVTPVSSPELRSSNCKPFEYTYSIKQNGHATLKRVESNETSIKFNGFITKQDIKEGIESRLNNIVEKYNLKELEFEHCTLYFTPNSNITDYNNNHLKFCSITTNHEFEVNHENIYYSFGTPKNIEMRAFTNTFKYYVKNINEDNCNEYGNFDSFDSFKEHCNEQCKYLYETYKYEKTKAINIIELLKNKPKDHFLLKIFDLNYDNILELVDVNIDENSDVYISSSRFLNHFSRNVEIAKSDFKKEELKLKKQQALEQIRLEEELEQIQKEKDKQISIIKTSLLSKYKKELFRISVRTSNQKRTILKYLEKEYEHLYEKKLEYCIATIRTKEQKLLGYLVYDNNFNLIVDNSCSPKLELN